MEDLLTIKQYAQSAGITEQAVYKQLRNENSQLYPYQVIVNGKKHIKPDALNLLKTNLNENADELDQVIVILQQQLSEKDKQIVYLQQINSQLLETNKQLTTSIEDLSESLRAAQALHAGTMQQSIQLAKTEDTVNESEPANKDTMTSNTIEEDTNVSPIENQELPKKTLIERLKSFFS